MDHNKYDFFFQYRAKLGKCKLFDTKKINKKKIKSGGTVNGHILSACVHYSHYIFGSQHLRENTF